MEESQEMHGDKNVIIVIDHERTHTHIHAEAEHESVPGQHITQPLTLTLNQTINQPTTTTTILQSNRGREHTNDEGSRRRETVFMPIARACEEGNRWDKLYCPGAVMYGMSQRNRLSLNNVRIPRHTTWPTWHQAVRV
mmetsp:Transcript_1530/g.3792  ORF Transcript_1530/g.3792 Transcript_1530/m.3792 type:complete len:138 (+) Transcript_1530:537-950(+)